LKVDVWMPASTFRETHGFTSRPTAFAHRQLRLVMDLATLQLVLSADRLAVATENPT